MSIAPFSAQQAFEKNKDNPLVQALLDLLGNTREQVVDWDITHHVYDTNYATFKATYQDGSQARGCISRMPQTGKWVAGGRVIPAPQAMRINAHRGGEIVNYEANTIRWQPGALVISRK